MCILVTFVYAYADRHVALLVKTISLIGLEIPPCVHRVEKHCSAH